MRLDKKALEEAAEKMRGYPINPVDARDMAEDVVRTYLKSVLCGNAADAPTGNLCCCCGRRHEPMDCPVPRGETPDLRYYDKLRIKEEGWP